MQYQYTLTNVIPSEDVDFLNSTHLQYFFQGYDNDPNDSGWCDAATGCRILSRDDVIIFHDLTEQDYLALIMRFENRVKN